MTLIQATNQVLALTLTQDMAIVVHQHPYTLNVSMHFLQHQGCLINKLNTARVTYTPVGREEETVITNEVKTIVIAEIIQVVPCGGNQLEINYYL